MCRALTEIGQVFRQWIIWDRLKAVPFFFCISDTCGIPQTRLWCCVNYLNYKRELFYVAYVFKSTQQLIEINRAITLIESVCKMRILFISILYALWINRELISQNILTHKQCSMMFEKAIHWSRVSGFFFRLSVQANGCVYIQFFCHLNPNNKHRRHNSYSDWNFYILQHHIAY